MIYAFDPGDTTGIAIFKETGEVVRLDQLLLEDLIPWLETEAAKQPEISTVVIEDFVLFAKRAVKQSGSRMKASQAIGALKLFASQVGAEVEMQPSSILPIAQKWSQVKMPSNHGQSHQFAAYNHGYYYLVTRRQMPTVLQHREAATNGQA